MPRARKIAAADCETDPFKRHRIPAPFIWGVYDGEDFWQFDSTAAMVDFLRDKPWIVYAHNGGKFDWHFVLDEIEPETDLIIIHGRLAKFKIGECEFRDSFNLLPMPLSAYKKDEVDYSIMEADQRDKPANREKIERYLRGDCRYLYEIVAGFVERYGRNLTLAGAAMRSWSKMMDIETPSTTPAYYNSIKDYYYGGRCEALEIGLLKGRFQAWDIKSAYPRAMMEDHPWGERRSITRELPKAREAIQRCFISLKCASTGAFPLTVDKTLTFPRDRAWREHHITGWEYLAAVDTGTLGDHHITKVTRYHDTIEFSAYIKHFYEMKSKAEPKSLDYIFAKLMMNALSGKFGANPDKYQSFKTIEPPRRIAYQKEGWKFAGNWGHVFVMSRPLPDFQRRYYNVATIASITGYTRAELWRAICNARRPIYCDTDSLFAEACPGLDIGPDLGQWEVEKAFPKGYDRAAIGGKKLYAIWDTKTGEEKTAHKGVKLTRAELIRVASGEAVKYDRDAPTFLLGRRDGKRAEFMGRVVKRKGAK